MTKRMLIDTTHAEETRVVVLDGNRLDDYDVETATKKQIKGNIYLAKIVRIEPSLQAAFVEYGGNRHGFLAFSEIHPDYYQIPVADRERLLALQEEEARAEEARADREEFGRGDADGDDGDRDDAEGTDPRAGSAEADAGDPGPAHRIEAGADAADTVRTDGPVTDAPPPDAPADAEHDDQEPDAGPIGLDIEHDMVVGEAGGTALIEAPADVPAEAPAETPEFEADEPAAPEQVSGESSHQDDGQAQRRTARFLRQYKIQEVMRRRQILLVQVVKEERGNKGAALTTYISLAGRFSVLMPNSPRGGGVSRKITSAADRRRLKEVTAELDLPRGMGMIIRTAGAQRPRQEILRDGEYLLRTWDDIRETTLASTAPCLVYEEASLIKRAIRDLYTRDIEEIVVDGEPGWKGAREFMRQLMPGSHGRVNLWRGAGNNGGQSLFGHHNVEQHLDAMLQPTVQLRSGGYLVINQTEALVAIDVNSGRSTRERSVEETALRTNLEAADEVARQLRLRDLAGLIVIDFIDMEASRNNRAVERRLKDALRNDRARIQVGTISAFGLMEMSRQRLRPSLAESSFVTCPHCNGSGYMRGTESSALHVLRAIEEEAAKRRSGEILVHVATPVALYVLNHKRQWLREIETRHHLVVNLATDDALVPPALRIEKLRPYAAPVGAVPDAAPDIAPAAATLPAAAPAPREARRIPIGTAPADPDAEAFDEREDAPNAAAPAEGRDGNDGEARTEEDGEKRRRRRRRRRGNRREDGTAAAGGESAGPDEEDDRPGEEVEDPAPTLRPGETLDSPSVFENGEEGGAAPVVAEAGGGGEAGERRGRRRRGGRNRNRGSERFGDERANRPDDGRAEESANDRDDAVPAAPRPGRAYSGPTPADPFAGSFDIFAMMEQDGDETATMADPSASAAQLGAAAEVPVPAEAEELPPAVEAVQASTPAVAEPIGTVAGDPDAMPDAKLPPAPLAQTAASVTGEPDTVPADAIGDPGTGLEAPEPAEREAGADAGAAPAKPARAPRARKPREPKAAAEPKPVAEPKTAKEPRAPRTRRSKAAAPDAGVAEAPAVDAAPPPAVAEAAAPDAPASAPVPGGVPEPATDGTAQAGQDPSIVRPVLIGDAPAPARRTGWWKR